VDFLIIPALTAISLFAFAALTDAPSVYFDAITVADELDKQGFKPNVVTDHLLERMQEIERGGFSREHGGQHSSDYDKTPVRVISDYLGTRNLIRTVQQSTGFVGVTIGGDVTVVGRTARFHLHGTGWHRPEFTLHEEAPVAEIDALIGRMAVQVMGETEPYQLALHKFRRAIDPAGLAEVEAIARRALGIVDPAERHWFHNILGIVRFVGGDAAGALEWLRQAIELAPDVGLQYSNVGMILAAQGRHDQAIGYFQRCAASPDTRPANFAVCYSEWGASLAVLGRDAEAVEKFAAAIKSDPAYADVYVEWGRLLRARGDGEAAEALFRKARELYPGQTVYTENLMSAVIHRAGSVAGRIGP